MVRLREFAPSGEPVPEAPLPIAVMVMVLAPGVATSVADPPSPQALRPVSPDNRTSSVNSACVPLCFGSFLRRKAISRPVRPLGRRY